MADQSPTKSSMQSPTKSSMQSPTKSSMHSPRRASRKVTGLAINTNHAMSPRESRRSSSMNLSQTTSPLLQGGEDETGFGGAPMSALSPGGKLKRLRAMMTAQNAAGALSRSTKGVGRETADVHFVAQLPKVSKLYSLAGSSMKFNPLMAQPASPIVKKPDMTFYFAGGPGSAFGRAGRRRSLDSASSASCGASTATDKSWPAKKEDPWAAAVTRRVPSIHHIRPFKIPDDPLGVRRRRPAKDKKKASVGKQASAAPPTVPGKRTKTNNTANGGEVDGTDSTISTGRIPLPNSDLVEMYPPDLQKAFLQLRSDRMRRFLLPCLRLFVRRRSRRMLTKRMLPGTAFLKKHTLFENMKDAVIQQCLAESISYSFEDGEVILHKGEPTNSGVYILVTGVALLFTVSTADASPTSRRFSRAKRNTASHGAVSSVVSGPMFLTDYTMLTEDRQQCTVKAAGHCEVLVVKRQTYRNAMKSLTHEDTLKLYDVAFSERNGLLENNNPVNHYYFGGKGNIFRRCPPSVHRLLVKRLTPSCVPTEWVLSKEGVVASEMYILMKGKCGAFSTVGGVATHVKTITPGEMINATELLQKKRCRYTVKTLGPCDLWKLTDEGLETALRSVPNVANVVSQEIISKREEDIHLDLLKFRGFVEQIPMFRDHIPRDRLRDLVRLFTPKVSNPMHVICSASTVCDRLIILTKGIVRVGERGTWKIGEAAGFTCIIPHRWGTSAVTSTAAEFLELSRDLYLAFLDDCGVFKKMKSVMLRLMFPNAFLSAEVQPIQAAVGKTTTKPLFPRSDSTFVNMKSAGFCMNQDGDSSLKKLKQLVDGTDSGDGDRRRSSSFSSVGTNHWRSNSTEQQANSQSDVHSVRTGKSKRSVVVGGDDHDDYEDLRAVIERSEQALPPPRVYIPLTSMHRVSSNMWAHSDRTRLL